MKFLGQTTRFNLFKGDIDIQSLCNTVEKLLKPLEKEGRLLENDIKEFLRSKATGKEKSKQTRILKKRVKVYINKLKNKLMPIQKRAVNLKKKLNKKSQNTELGRQRLGIIDKLLEFLRMIFRVPFQIVCSIIDCGDDNGSNMLVLLSTPSPLIPITGPPPQPPSSTQKSEPTSEPEPEPKPEPESHPDPDMVESEGSGENLDEEKESKSKDVNKNLD